MKTLINKKEREIPNLFENICGCIYVVDFVLCCHNIL